MKPGRELDKLVALAIGWHEQQQEGFGSLTVQWYTGDGKRAWHKGSFCPSEDIEAAMIAFEWLENNHPWGQNIFLCLCRGGVRKEHQSVRINQTGEWEEIVAHREIIGESYAHAICLAVLLAKVETRF